MCFALDSPPVPWLDLGWIESFVRYYDTPTDVMRSGANALAGAQFRGPIEARVEFDFREWGKLQMALGGWVGEHERAGDQSRARRRRLRAEYRFGGSGVGGFDGEPACLWRRCLWVHLRAGNLLAVDVDYQQQVGYVGSGISAAYVSNPAR